MTNLAWKNLDEIANEAKRTIFRNRKVPTDEFNYYMLSTLLKRAQKNNFYGIVDFGGGHSVYDDENIFEKVKAMLKPFQNVVLLLPDKDEEKALRIMNERATGDTRDNRKFLESPCNRELATMVIYENNRKPSEIAQEILLRMKERKQQQEKE